MTTEQPPPMHSAIMTSKDHLRRLSCTCASDLATPAGNSAESSPRHTPSSSADAAASVVDFAAARQKSAKRRATEALLASRFGSTSSLLGAAASPAQGHPSASKRPRPAEPSSRPPVAVPACSGGCGGCQQHHEEQQQEAGWCEQPVALPAMDWPAALRPVASNEVTPDSTGTCQLPGGITVRIVTRAEQLPAALAALRASMADTICAIDLEWKPDCYMGNGGSGGSNGTTSRVALMQLASATLCVLVRTCRLRAAPSALLDFLSDPTITLVGYSWDSADQAKLSAAFGFGRERFARFHDLQTVSQQLGYHGYGLGALTQQVLGFAAPKNRKVTMSNWEAWNLSSQQVQYAALDAIIAGHIFRGLRLWHACPSACASCRHPLGRVLPAPNHWNCKTCSKQFDTLSAALSHVRSKHHEPTWSQCQECGRTSA